MLYNKSYTANNRPAGHTAVISFKAIVFAALITLSASVFFPCAADTGNSIGTLDPALRYLISADIGKDNARYHIMAATSAGRQVYEAFNAGQGIRASIHERGMEIRWGNDNWSVTLDGIEADGKRLPVDFSTVAVKRSANRLEITSGSVNGRGQTVTQWYVNGPYGLQQGWTIDSGQQPRTESGSGSGNSIVVLNLKTSGTLKAGKDEATQRGNNVTQIGLYTYDGQKGPAAPQRGVANSPVYKVLTYGGLYAYDANEKRLPAWFEVSADSSVLQIKVDATSAVYPVVIDPWVQSATLTNSGGAAGDHFGESIAISADGSTVAVGAWNVSSGKGAVYVYQKSVGWTTTGTPTATLTKSGGAAGDYFGYSVAISGDGGTVVAGAYGTSSGTGAAYVYQKGTTWTDNSTPTAALTNSGGTLLDILGYSVAISEDGNTIVAGAHGTSSNKGAAHVYQKGTGWATTGIPTATLTNSGGAANDSFGSVVAINGDGSTVLAGAPGVASSKGAAYVYQKGTGWATTGTPTATLTNSGGAANDFLGISAALSLDANTIVVGAEHVSSNKGAAYVYLKGTGWATTGTPTATLTNSGGAANDYFGVSMAISGNGSTVLAGVYGVSSSTGAAYVYQKGTTWANMGTPTATLVSSGGAGGNFGYSVAMSSDGHTIAAGAYGVASSKGAAYVFTGNNSWVFGSAAPYTVGNPPYSVAVGDFNGDGIPDLAVASDLTSLNVSILLGAGDGTFGAASTYSAGSGPYSVAVGDFNGDGKPDLAVANFGSSNVSILLGAGNGTFNAAVNYSAGANPSSIAVGDFNGDGKPDLAVANYTDGTVSIFLGVGNGTFPGSPNYTYNVGSKPYSVAVGDFNGDGIPDLAVANSWGNSVSVFLGVGNGTFTEVSGSPFSVGLKPLSVAVGDFNGDGKPDLATANYTDGTVSVLLGNGTGQFNLAASPTAGSAPYAVAVGDFNGDGIPDLAVANESSLNVSILLGAGNGTFATAVNYSFGGNPYSLAVGDFNGDGIPDLAVTIANSNPTTVSVLLGKIPPIISVPASMPDFASVAVGSTLPQTLTISNTGVGNLSVTNVALADTTDYSINLTGCGGTLPLTVTPAGCSIVVTFQPQSTAAHNTTLTITSNTGNVPGTNTVVNLTGTGTPSAPGAATLISPTGTITTPTPDYTWNAVSNATSYILTIYDSTNTQIYTLTATAIALGCSSVPGTCTATQAAFSTPTLSSGTYTWRVQAVNNGVNGPVSTLMGFTVNFASATFTMAGTGSGSIYYNGQYYTNNFVLAFNGNSSMTLYFVPNTGSKLANVTVNGVSQGPVNALTLENTGTGYGYNITVQFN